MLMMYHRMFLRTFFFNQKESMTQELKDRSKNGPWCEMTEREETQGTRWIVGWRGGRGGAWTICCQSSIIPGFPTQTLPISNPEALFTWPLLLRPLGCSKAPLPSRAPLLTNKLLLHACLSKHTQIPWNSSAVSPKISCDLHTRCVCFHGQIFRLEMNKGKFKGGGETVVYEHRHSATARNSSVSPPFPPFPCYWIHG